MAVKAIVLGAGKGKRMRSDLPKVLHEAAGRPLLHWVLDAVAALGCDEVVVVVGHQADAVRRSLPAGTTTALQQRQLGTGDAAAAGLAEITLATDDVVVILPGDMPLVTGETLRNLVAHHRQTGAAATMLTVILADPDNYGRVLRSEGNVIGIVEEVDATAEQRKIHEVCTSVYVFDADVLPTALEQLTTENAQGEYYLTDAIGILAAQGRTIEAYIGATEEGFGVNDPDQLAAVESILTTR
jgi:bifunctional UDP-N-acetylglucosamine pyrophosphorylase/glucosamine-1-phosphate N-acetyltransferase